MHRSNIKDVEKKGKQQWYAQIKYKTHRIKEET
jgi:hypothetical protein